MVGRASTNRGSRKFSDKAHVLAEPASAWVMHHEVEIWLLLVPVRRPPYTKHPGQSVKKIKDSAIDSGEAHCEDPTRQRGEFGRSPSHPFCFDNAENFRRPH
jgi:hypothetical protein